MVTDKEKEQQLNLTMEELAKDENAGKKFKKVLVVDDILYVVKSISKILREEGFFVITALSGNEAFDKFIKYAPDLITIDQKLPDMSGIQLVEKIRKHNIEPQPKIIFISGVQDKEEIKSILQLEINNYLLKPFRKNDLISVVRELIGGE